MKMWMVIGAVTTMSLVVPTLSMENTPDQRGKPVQQSADHQRYAQAQRDWEKGYYQFSRRCGKVVPLALYEYQHDQLCDRVLVDAHGSKLFRVERDGCIDFFSSYTEGTAQAVKVPSEQQRETARFLVPMVACLLAQNPANQELTVLYAEMLFVPSALRIFKPIEGNNDQ